jgi:hypothetical protein
METAHGTRQKAQAKIRQYRTQPCAKRLFRIGDETGFRHPMRQFLLMFHF